MYNPLPSGKTAKSDVSRSTPIWQPLKPLKSIELQNAGFVQEKYSRTKPSNFSLWTVEEQLAAGKLAQDAQDIASSDFTPDADQSALDSEGGSDHFDSEIDSNASLSGLDAEAIEKIKNEAYERGVSDGKRLQQEANSAEAEKAESESLTVLAEKANQILTSIEKGVVALQENPASWNEPLKRLALHLAEQLTLTELSISAIGIQNMIDRCIETLDVQTASSVVVELNPNDMVLLQNHKAAPGEKTSQWRLVADSHLLPGSVRVRADDAVVSDLIENRLETLAQALLQNTKPWQAQTAFQPERLAARRGKTETVEDAFPRDTSSRFAKVADLDAAADVVELTPSPVSEFAEPLNLSSLNLPDLDLSDSNFKNDEDDLGNAND